MTGKNRIRLTLTLIAAAFSFQLLAQPNLNMSDLAFQEDTKAGRWFIVPETSFWIGTYTNIELAPQIGYHLTDRWSLGIGPHYIYYENNDFFSPVNFSTHIYGGKIFSRLNLIQDAGEFLPIYLFDELFFHAEYELLSLENQHFNAPSFPSEGRFWADYYYVGVGINQRVSMNSSYFIVLLWNLNDSIYSIYSNPTYRVGFTIFL